MSEVDRQEVRLPEFMYGRPYGRPLAKFHRIDRDGRTYCGLFDGVKNWERMLPHMPEGLACVNCRKAWGARIRRASLAIAGESAESAAIGGLRKNSGL